MNERIQELMKEAQVIYDYAPFYGDMDRDPKPLYKLDPEKFAELIVRECFQVVDEYGVQRSDENLLIGVEICNGANKIKEHFGVES